MSLSAIVTATGLTYVLSEKYRSSTTILIRPTKSIDLVPKRQEMLSFPVSYYTPLATATKTYTEITQSRAIAERVVRRLGLDIVHEPVGSGVAYTIKQWAGLAKGALVKSWDFLKYGRIEQLDAFSHAVGEVKKGLTVKPTKDTYLFELEAEARSPEGAAAIANAAAAEFVGFLQDLHAKESAKAEELSRTKLKQSQADLDAAREALVEFQRIEGVVSLPEETVIELQKISDLDHSRTLIGRDISGALAQAADIDKQLSRMERFSRSSEKRIDNPIVRQLQLALAQREVQLAGLAEKYKPEHKDIQALRAEIEGIRAQLADLDPTLVSEETMEVDPLYQALVRERAEIQAQLEAYRAKEERLRETIEQRRGVLEGMPQQQAGLSRLQLDVHLKEQMHVLLSKEVEEFALAASRQTPDIEITHAAVPALYPTRPIKVYHALLALALSLPTALGIILLEERLQRGIRSVEEAQSALKCTVLMTVPHEKRLKRDEWPLITEAARSLPEVRRDSMRSYVRRSIKIGRRGTGDHVAGETADIGPNGALVYVDRSLALEPDARVEIVFDIDVPNSERSILEGVVLRCDEAREDDRSLAAIKFVNVDPEGAALLDRWIGSHGSLQVTATGPQLDEPIRGLRTDLGLFRNGQVSSLLITSCDNGDGKSTISANLGLSLAALNRKVVLVDANLRHPSLHRVFRLENRAGLLDALTGRASWMLTKVSAGLTILPSGGQVGDPSAVLGSPKLAVLLESLKNEFDYVLIDSPGILIGPDAGVLASIVDGVVLVLDSGVTTVEQARRAEHILGRAKAELLGVVMNNYDKDFEPFYSGRRAYSVT